MKDNKFGNYLNLRLELRRVGVTQEQVADHLGMSTSNLVNKLSGKTPFTVAEIVDIRDTFAPDATIDYLTETA